MDRARDPPDAAGEGDRGLRRELSTFSLAAVIVGAMVGSGIFFLPGPMLGQAGGAWPVMAAWVGGAIVALAGGLVFAELGAAFPKAGGQYAFLREALGPGWAFLFAWAGFAVVQTGTVAAVAVALANAVDYLVVLPGSTPCVGSEGADGLCDGLVLPKWGTGFLAVAVILALTLVNHFGVRRGAWVNDGAGVAKVAALLAIAALAFAFGGRGAGNFSGPGSGWGATTLGGFGLALSASLFAYDGFAQATFVAAEAKDARRALPRAIVLATASVAALYLAVTLAYYHVLPVGALSDAARAGDLPIATEAMGQVLGSAAAAVVAAAIVVSTFGTVNTYVLTGARVYYPVAREGRFPSAFGLLNRHGAPAYGLWYGALWAGILAMTGSYARLADLVVFGLYVFYVATMAAYFVLRRRRPDAFRAAGFRMPLRPLPAAFFAVASVAVLCFYLAKDLPLLADGRPGAFLASTTGMGLLLLGTGVALYAVARGRQASGRR